MNGCVNTATIPRDALCQDCLYMKGRQKEPPSLLVCGFSHRRPAQQAVVALMEAWIDGFKASDLQVAICVNLVGGSSRAGLVDAPSKATAVAYGPMEKLERPPNRKVEIVFNTQTGAARPVDLVKDIVVKSSEETPCYIMQMLTFNGQLALTFFDSGANQNLVQAELARNAGFFQSSANPVTITVAGGGELMSADGQYVAVLGACADGRNYYIEAQAVQQITKNFPRVNLDPVIQEARMTMPSGTQYPRETGGGEVKLLVGIRNTDLAPRMLLTLPSGVSVYESKLLDIYGSNICFGGPHEIFTRAYQRCGVNLQVANLQVLFTEMATAYMQSPWLGVCEVEKVPFQEEPVLLEVKMLKQPEFSQHAVELALEAEPALALLVPGSSLSLDDHLNRSLGETSVPILGADNPIKPSATGEVPDEHKEEASECHRSEDCNVPHSCFKSFMPLSKLKGLVDELDIGDPTDFRCETCSNCMVCRMSARTKTKSLQETYEQEAIEHSVVLDSDNERVVVKLPFVRDPVEYLTHKHGVKYARDPVPLCVFPAL